MAKESVEEMWMVERLKIVRLKILLFRWKTQSSWIFIWNLNSKCSWRFEFLPSYEWLPNELFRKFDLKFKYSWIREEAVEHSIEFALFFCIDFVLSNSRSKIFESILSFQLSQHMTHGYVATEISPNSFEFLI